MFLHVLSRKKKKINNVVFHLSHVYAYVIEFEVFTYVIYNLT